MRWCTDSFRIFVVCFLSWIVILLYEVLFLPTFGWAEKPANWLCKKLYDWLPEEEKQAPIIF